MTLKIERWPFLPFESRSPQETERWWAECYVPTVAADMLQDLSRSVIVSGCAGSGKSVAAAALVRETAGRSLIIEYPPAYWPGGKHAWLTEGNHLRQMMACAANRVRELLSSQPDLLAGLTVVKQEFLRWLIQKHLDERALPRLADKIKSPDSQPLFNLPFKDIYSTDSTPAHAKGQIEELVDLVEGLGFETVIVLIDLPETNSQLEGVAGLFEWLELLQHPGFTIKTTLPETAVEGARISDEVRGRITITPLLWSRKTCQMVANRHLRAAIPSQRRELADLAVSSLLDELAAEVEKLFDQPTPRGWMALAAALLESYATTNKPLANADRDKVVCAFYAKCAPLRLDRSRQGVWRGPQFIALDDQPFRFLEVLWEAGDSSTTMNALLEIAGSKENVNTLASRVRKKIEPVPKTPIYFHNERGQGYRLDDHLARKG